MSLASLSIFCDEVSDLQVDAVRPALLFRLHDFPTVLLRPAEQHSVTSGQSLAFARGKSCLLEWPSGGQPAGAVKLQLLLVDLLEPPGAPASVAGKGVLLGRAVCEVALSGVASPFTAATLKMRDLAGNEVAVVRTRHRLAALGASLIPHLVQSLRTPPLRAAGGEGGAAGVAGLPFEPRAASRAVDVITEPAMVEPLPKVLVAGTSAAAEGKAPSPHRRQSPPSLFFHNLGAEETQQQARAAAAAAARAPPRRGCTAHHARKEPY